MELVHEKRKTSKITPEDVINSMPENVITNILDRLPIKEAVKTGILSKKWQYMWNMVTELVFDNAFFKLGLATGKSYDYGKIISRILLCLDGPIIKFDLHIANGIILDDEDICLWVLFLSRNGIKEFALTNFRKTLLVKLPARLYSCLELKHLKLHGCRFHVPHNFSGFPNLLSLALSYIAFESGSCMDFISTGKPPLLEVLNIRCLRQTSKIKRVEIAKLVNLKMLRLPLCNIDHVAITSSGILEYVGFLPKLRALSLTFEHSKLVVESGAIREVPATFSCLKILILYPIDFSCSIALSCVFGMIWRCPNVRSLIIGGKQNPQPVISSIEVDYCSSKRKDCSTVGKLQLRNVVFTSCWCLETELYLIKHLLASSPFLKRITIHTTCKEKYSGFASKLLNLPRASPTASPYFAKGSIINSWISDKKKRQIPVKLVLAVAPGAVALGAKVWVFSFKY